MGLERNGDDSRSPERGCVRLVLGFFLAGDAIICYFFGSRLIVNEQADDREIFVSFIILSVESLKSM